VTTRIGRRNRVGALAAPISLVLLVSLVLGGCSGRHSTSTGAPTRHVTTTETITRPASSGASFSPPGATAVTGRVGPSDPLPPGETAGACPYISDDDARDAEGDRVGRTSLLPALSPVGCRFYFQYAPYQAIADIIPATFATATQAYNAMVATGNASATVLGVKDLVPGVDAVLFRTAFNPADGLDDWACAFSAGPVLVIVHTQQTNTSQDARNFAVAIAAKF
jgi:hypothetical protein